MSITNVCVIGAGIMGSGIAQLVSFHGYNVELVDLNGNLLNRAKKSIEMNLQKFFVEKSKISDGEKTNILNRIHLSTDIKKSVKNVQMVIEAVDENLILKQELFSELDDICDHNVILASNTSALSITDIASKSNNKGRIVGIHFFNPAPVMKLIELIKSEHTTEDTLIKSKEFSENLNKTVVTIIDSPGFVTSRLIYVLCNEAINLLSNGIASANDIDKACKLAFNFPMGPIELSDLVGNDIYYHIGEYLAKELGDKYQPSSLLKKMVDEKLLGRKTKSGFYKY
ncbi:MAG: 3-hydroxyacyl-CoA dehydrogenase family protein [Promethearchaeota archaeon]|jgi:3-hydroxybutyryl-CoA dehydrogenase